ncbi:MAG: tRNA (guanosine(37)-N1)-methyltransferase TrmD [Kiritimatiellia bacterium]
MAPLLRIDIVTIFPRMLEGFTGESMLKRAVRRGLVRIGFVNPRDFTSDRHRTTDDRPYGGGAGMVMKPEPLYKAVESVRGPESRVVLMTPQGRVFNQASALELSRGKHVVVVCGHYEGIDERVRRLASDEISIGDYVLTNGALAAAVLADAVVRLVPGVVGGEGAVENESFSDGRLDYPQYTRPEEFRGMRVPGVLLSGNHEQIAEWRGEQSEIRTGKRRPDLIQNHETGGKKR